MTSRAEKKKACSGPPRKKNQPYDNRPRPGQDRTKGRTSQGASVVRVVMPDEPPQLNPEAARVLLRILLKAYDRLNGTDNPEGGAK